MHAQHGYSFTYRMAYVCSHALLQRNIDGVNARLAAKAASDSSGLLHLTRLVQLLLACAVNAPATAEASYGMVALHCR